MTVVENPAGPGRTKDHPGTRVPDQRILSTFTSNPQDSLPKLCDDLLRHQLSSWSQLADGYSAFKEVRSREVKCQGYSVVVQFNPARITSSGAKMDPQSIRDRKCFLCVGNLPPGQKGVLYGDEFLVLCNPAPILDKHLTISHIAHIPQAVEGLVRVFLDLAKQMSPTFTVFYNGPKCGASAPDHMHFQASPGGAIPVEKEAADPARRELRTSMGSTSIFSLKGMGREIIVIEGGVQSEMENVLARLFKFLRRVLGTEDEPMINMLCSYQGAQWRLILFPRRKHRPDAYFSDGDDRVMISPAAIDVGGLVVTPLESDFRRVDAQMIQTIFDDVMLDKATVDRVISAF